MKKLIGKWLGIEELSAIVHNHGIELYRLNEPFKFNLGDEVNLVGFPIQGYDSGFVVDRKWSESLFDYCEKRYLISINNKTAHWVQEGRITLKTPPLKSNK